MIDLHLLKCISSVAYERFLGKSLIPLQSQFLMSCRYDDSSPGKLKICYTYVLLSSKAVFSLKMARHLTHASEKTLRCFFFFAPELTTKRCLRVIYHVGKITIMLVLRGYAWSLEYFYGMFRR